MTRPASGLLALPFLIIAVTAPCAGQTGSRPVMLPVDSLAWISGHWLATDDFATREGFWTEPSAGAMTGLFRVIEGDRVVRFELLLLEQSDAGPVLSRRTYGHSLSPGADTEQWTGLRLREVSGRRAWFSASALTTPLSVIIERTAEDHLVVTVERLCNGQRSAASIEYARQRP